MEATPARETRRICIKCLESKPLRAEYFQPQRHGRIKVYFSLTCRVCMAARRRARYDEQDLYRRYGKRYYETHKDAILVKAKRRRLTRALAAKGR